MLNYFTVEKVSDSITRIRTFLNVCVYLIEGTERAVLVDTGEGIGDLKKVISHLTEKPYTVVLTHGHVDHINGSGQFGEVWLNRNDWDIYKRDSDPKFRLTLLKQKLGDQMEQIPLSDFILPGEGGLLPLEDGQEFPLGGITLKMISVPGHTQGMMCVLVKEERTMLFGDACGTCGFLFKKESSTITEYEKSLQCLKQWETEYDRVLRNHGTCESQKTILDENIAVCRDILSGNTDDIPFTYRGETYLLAKAVDEKGRRLDGKEGNIVFDPKRIR